MDLASFYVNETFAKRSPFSCNVACLIREADLHPSVKVRYRRRRVAAIAVNLRHNSLHYKAAENIDEILTADGIDSFFIGPTDLTTSIGVRGHKDHPKFTAALEKVLEASRKYGTPGGIMTYNVEQARKALERGFKFISLSTDFCLLIQGARTMLDSVSQNSTCGT